MTKAPELRLKPRAKADHDDFRNRYGRDGNCSCHLGVASCASCTHPGHPLNLEGNENAWTTEWSDAEGDAYDHFWIERRAARMGVAWVDFCRERDRIKLPSGGFARSVWESCDLNARKSMMEQYRAMTDNHFEEKKAESWGSW